MPSFEELFRESQGQPVKYKQHVIQLFDRVPIASDQRVRVVFESVQSDWNQGVALDTEGEFQVDDHPPVKKGVALWCKAPPRQFLVHIKSKKRQCLIKNVWDVGDGVMHSWHNGAAMIVEEIRNGRRYRCNDGRPDDDFDDLVFRIELLPPLALIVGKDVGNKRIKRDQS